MMQLETAPYHRRDNTAKIATTKKNAEPGAATDWIFFTELPTAAARSQAKASVKA